MPTERLKQITKEIEAILNKHDVAGSVVIQDKEDLEYLYKLDPSWGCIQMVGEQIRIKAAIHSGPPEEKEKLRLSAGLLMAFHSQAEHTIQDMEQLIKLISSCGVSIQQTMRRK